MSPPAGVGVGAALAPSLDFPISACGAHFEFVRNVLSSLIHISPSLFLFEQHSDGFWTMEMLQAAGLCLACWGQQGAAVGLQLWAAVGLSSGCSMPPSAARAIAVPWPCPSATCMALPGSWPWGSDGTSPPHHGCGSSWHMLLPPAPITVPQVPCIAGQCWQGLTWGTAAQGPEPQSSQGVKGSRVGAKVRFGAGSGERGMEVAAVGEA